MNTSFNNFIVSFLHSFGQIMLQKNVVTGSLFVLGIGLNSPMMLSGGVISTLSGLATAHFFKFEQSAIDDGIYGFNAALVGVAALFFFEPSFFMLALVTIGGAVSTAFMRLIRISLPGLSPLTAPFVVATWAIVFIADLSGVSISTPVLSIDSGGYFYSVLRGVGQVIFQGHWFVGVIFVLGLFLSSQNAALWAVLGSGLGIVVASIFGFPEESVLMGLYGFNAGLVAIALCGRGGGNVLPIFLGVTISVLLTRFFELANLPVLTAPFVLASWMVMYWRKV